MADGGGTEVTRAACEFGTRCDTADCSLCARGGGYTVKPSRIRGLSPAYRRELTAWQSRVRAAESHAADRITRKTAVSLVIVARDARLAAWANGGPDWRANNRAARAAGKAAPVTVAPITPPADTTTRCVARPAGARAPVAMLPSSPLRLVACARAVASVSTLRELRALERAIDARLREARKAA